MSTPEPAASSEAEIRTQLCADLATELGVELPDSVQLYGPGEHVFIVLNLNRARRLLDRLRGEHRDTTRPWQCAQSNEFGRCGRWNKAEATACPRCCDPGFLAARGLDAEGVPLPASLRGES